MVYFHAITSLGENTKIYVDCVEKYVYFTLTIFLKYKIYFNVLVNYCTLFMAPPTIYMSICITKSIRKLRNSYLFKNITIINTSEVFNNFNLYVTRRKKNWYLQLLFVWIPNIIFERILTFPGFTCYAVCGNPGYESPTVKYLIYRR